MKRSLTHVGGAVEREGEPRASELLARALDVAAARQGENEEGEDRAHVHGFHTYPARMHPVTARRLVEAFAPPRGAVLDPFCGSGTVLVEAMIAGRDAIGVDLNPLAVHLATLKTHVARPAELEAMVTLAREVAEDAERRRKERAGASKRYGPEDVAAFEPHVLLALDSLARGIARAPGGFARQALALVLSSILVKVSRKKSDTSEEEAPRRIAAGYTPKLFVKKTEELARRMAEFGQLVPRRPAPQARVSEDDAARLATVPTASADAVVTSPPYVATYDYLAHHALRLRWLGLDTSGFEKGEIGARRRYANATAEETRTRWEDEIGQMLRALHRAVRPGGAIVLLLADSAVRGGAIRADHVVASAARAAGLRPVARASQARPHFHGPTARAFDREPRREHALLLTR